MKKVWGQCRDGMDRMCSRMTESCPTVHKSHLHKYPIFHVNADDPEAVMHACVQIICMYVCMNIAIFVVFWNRLVSFVVITIGVPDAVRLLDLLIVNTSHVGIINELLKIFMWV